MDTENIEDQTNSLDDYYCDDYDDNDNDKECDEYYDYDGNDGNANRYTPDLVTCDNCGNVWDGYAQCNCLQLTWDDEQLLEKAAPKISEQLLEQEALKISEQLLEQDAPKISEQLLEKAAPKISESNTIKS